MKIFPDLIKTYIREKQESKGLDFCAKSWLDSASKRASQISVATHVLKYSHSDAKGTNIYVKAGSIKESCPQRYVSTNSLYSVRDDVVGNAAALDVAGLLQIELDGVTFLDLIAKGESSPLAPFAENEAQLSSWMRGFKSVLTDREPRSHTLAKQVYFPVKDSEYHLLSPMYASSLSQALYDRIIGDRFGEEAKEGRECKRKEKYSDIVVVDYPNLAIQMFGGTKPQNISRLNIIRRGRSYLLRSTPPIWTSIKKPPLRKNAFWKSFGNRVAPFLGEFKRYLITVINLDGNKDIRDQREKYVNQLLDCLIQIAAEVQTMAPGWSKTSEISEYEKFWLDPLCVDQDFQIMRSQEAWKESVANRFATWLIQKLEDKNLKFNDTHHKELSSSCLKILKAVE